MTDDYETQFKDTDTDQTFHIRMNDSISKITETAERLEALLVQDGYVDQGTVDMNPEASSEIRFTAEDEANELEVNFDMRGSRTQVRETASNLQNLLTENGFEVD